MNLEMENNRLRFYQWDTGQRLIVEDGGSCAEVHFANAHTPQALVCSIREENGVRVADVPNILLQNPVSFTAYLFSYADDGAQTRYAKSFAVCSRPKPEDYVYTETEVQSYKALDDRITKLENADAVDPEVIAASVDQYLAQNPIKAEDIGALSADQLPEAINDALEQAKGSGEFDGKTPVKGVDYFTDEDKQEIAEQAAELVEIPNGGAEPAIIFDSGEITEEVNLIGPIDISGYSKIRILGKAYPSENSAGKRAAMLCFEKASNKKVLCNAGNGKLFDTAGNPVSFLIYLDKGAKVWTTHSYSNWNAGPTFDATESYAVSSMASTSDGGALIYTNYYNEKEMYICAQDDTATRPWGVGTRIMVVGDV